VHISDVDFTPRKGQWWARLKPLSLARILEDLEPNGCLSIEFFAPDEPYGNVWSLVPPIGYPIFRYLWCHEERPIEWFRYARTDDVFVVQKTGNLFFTVRDPDRNICLCLSDTPLTDDDIISSRLVQQGPEPPQGPTLFDKLRDDNHSAPEPPLNPTTPLEIEPLPIDPTDPDA
jgi:hypothetical protein